VIEFACPCGRSLKAEDGLVGRCVRCPACGAEVQVPPGQEPALSGPEALQAAMREARVQQPAADVPVAEVVEEPADVEEAAEGLEALARAVGSASGAAGQASKPRSQRQRPGRASQTTPQGREGSRKPNLTPGPNGALNGKAQQKKKRAMVIGACAAVGLLLLIMILVMATRDGTPPEEPATPPPVVETKKRHRYTGPQPGELFGKVPFEEEEEGTDEQE